MKSLKKFQSLIKNRDFWLVVIVLIFGFYSGFFQELFLPVNTARLEIDYGEKRRAFEGELLSSMSVLDALLAASRGGDFEVRYAILEDAADIMRIDGLAEDGLDGEWVFYLNNRRLEAAEIHKVRVRAGDKILVKFE
ncbi:MAG: hypothetical protein HYS78_01510 [Parcubacteria group bacterium]|nr:hypothetical protein [Parcubacteria group bacterium]